MPGIVVKADDAHRYAGELHTERLEREVAALADAGGRMVAINDRLAARVADLEQALRSLVEEEAVVSTWGGYAECAYCGGACHLDNPVEHAADCAWVRAKALLAGPGGA